MNNLNLSFCYNTFVNKKGISTGNAVLEGKSNNNRGWFVGAFIEQTGLQTNNDVEIKWGIHPKGERRFSKAVEGNATTISILIRGKYTITFENGEKNELANEGDYVMWSPNLPHEFEALEDSVAVTIRWPSLSSKRN